MIYVCKVCSFVFERVGVIEHCPSCGKNNIREANEEEKEKYLSCKKQIKNISIKNQ